MSFLDTFFRGTNKREVISWAFFDFANSAYAVLIFSFVFPIFFKEVIARSAAGDFFWGLIVSISILLGGFSSPIIGAVADYDARRKRKFILFTIIAVMGTSSLYFTGPNMLFLASLIFIITHLFYILSTTLYDSFLVNVSTRETSGRISGLGWGLGYLGGVVAILLFKPFYSQSFENMHLYKLTFPMTGLFFLVFSLPLFFYLRESRVRKKKVAFINMVKVGFRRTFSTVKEVRKHKNIAWFLVAFYFLNDALVTLFAFFSIYARTTISFSIAEITTLLILVQLIGFPAAAFFGWLSDKKGSKRILLLTIALWAFVVLIMSIATSKGIFYFISIVTGLIVGSSQAVARSWLSKIIPSKKRSEFFGFNSFASKLSATTGPVIFGSVSSLTGNQRIAMLTLLPFFIISFIIFSRIGDKS